MGRRLRGLFVALAASLVLAAPASAEPDVYGLTTDDTLVRFNVSDPSSVTPVAALDGLEPGEHAVAIAWPYDFERPRAFPGKLFLLTDASRLYRVDAGTGNLSSEGPPLTPAVKGDWFGMTLQGNSSDYLVAYSDQGQSLGIAPALGWPTDGSFPMGTPSPAGVAHAKQARYDDADVAAGQTPSLVGAAVEFRPLTETYSVDDRIFAIDAARGTLVRAHSAHEEFATVGALGVPVGPRSGFALSVHGPGPGPGLLATAPPGTTASRLYSVNMQTGAATAAGTLPDGVVVRSVAYVPPPTVQIHGSNLGLIDYGLPTHAGTVERTGDPLPAVSVDWTLGCGQWGCPEDGAPARPQGGTIEFAPHQRLAGYTIDTQRVDWGPFETRFEMDNPSAGALLGLYSSMTYLFFDDQPKIDPPEDAVHSSDGVAQVTVERTLHAAGRSARVTYTSKGGTAVAGRDYVPVHGALTLAKGQTRKTFALRLAAGKSDGSRRTVGLQLRSAGGLAKHRATLALVSDRKLRVKLEHGHVTDGRLPVVIRCTGTCHGGVTVRDSHGKRLARHSVRAARGARLKLRLHVGDGTPATVEADVRDGLGRRAHRFLRLR